MSENSQAAANSQNAPTLIGLAYPAEYAYWRHVIEGLKDYSRDHPHLRYVFRNRTSGPIARSASVNMAGFIASTPSQLPSGLPDDMPRVFLMQPAAPYVSPAQAACGTAACEHLLERGLSSFAAIQHNSQTERQRIKGFVNRAAQDHIHTHIFATDSPIERRDWELDEPLGELTRFLQPLPKPLGLACADSFQAEWSLYACELAALRVPGDVAIISCVDDDMVLANLQPSISGVMLDQRRAGYEAAHLVHQMLEGNRPVNNVAIPPIGVIERESTQIFKAQDQWVEEVVAYIWQHVVDRASVEHLADVFAVSERTLHRRFNAALGRGPRQEIRRSRIQTAIKLLTSTHMRLIDVAAAAGFSSQSLMGRYIKAQTGMTAAQLRRHSRG